MKTVTKMHSFSDADLKNIMENCSKFLVTATKETLESIAASLCENAPPEFHFRSEATKIYIVAVATGVVIANTIYEPKERTDN